MIIHLNQQPNGWWSLDARVQRGRFQRHEFAVSCSTLDGVLSEFRHAVCAKSVDHR